MAGRLAGLAAHVRPAFMLPVIGTSVCGAMLAPTVSGWTGGQHAVAVGTALFVAHLRDGLVDGHVRGEEEPPLSVSAYRWATGAGTAVAILLAASLTMSAGALAGGSVLVLLGLALLHAPYLDRHPVPVTVDYPVGIAITLAGGFATQTGRLPTGVVAVAASTAVLLAGIKVGIDRLDAAFDRTIGKRTVPVITGTTGTRAVAVGSFATAALSVGGIVWVGVLPPIAAVAAVAAGGCAAATLLVPARSAVRVQMVLSYVFVGTLVAARCDGACAGWTVVTKVAPLSAVRQVQFDLVGRGPELIEYLALAACP
ncbi:ubiquinone biosynthesis protein UbiA [Haloarcula montana]|uniref:ubiquinone biosynthesis protein UbiA n=1 Tax=Haloarcula montana TaxID=3111776 RepID=UPI002D793729|nr:ubiquinone biosynthesis protein UbiA [Haloarcula sp. GH36]